MTTTLSTLRKYLNNTKNDWNYITPVDFYNNHYIKNKNFVLVDLRKKEDFDKFHIKDSINIFWLDILKNENLEKLPTDKTIFLICYVGHTSSQIMVLLKLLNYTVVSIKFGYGISPAFGIPVAGWLSYGFPVENMIPVISKCKNIH
jgi:rhodanese-related sulfurtransferase